MLSCRSFCTHSTCLLKYMITHIFISIVCHPFDCLLDNMSVSLFAPLCVCLFSLGFFLFFYSSYPLLLFLSSLPSFFPSLLFSFFLPLPFLLFIPPFFLLSLLQSFLPPSFLPSFLTTPFFHFFLLSSFIPPFLLPFIPYFYYNCHYCNYYHYFHCHGVCFLIHMFHGKNIRKVTLKH